MASLEPRPALIRRKLIYNQIFKLAATSPAAFATNTAAADAEADHAAKRLGDWEEVSAHASLNHDSFISDSGYWLPWFARPEVVCVSARDEAGLKMRHLQTARFLGLLIASVIAMSASAGVSPRVITIMSYNAENLFDTQDNPSNEGDNTYLPLSNKVRPRTTPYVTSCPAASKKNARSSTGRTRFSGQNFAT
jgi:hypothetical protein